MLNGGYYTDCLLHEIKGEKYSKRKLFIKHKLFQIGIAILLSLIFLNVGKAQKIELVLGNEFSVLPENFDTTEVIITYADTLGIEQNYILTSIPPISVSERLYNNQIYWFFGYKTEGNLLDDRKKPIDPKYIILDYKPLKWNRE